MWHPKVSWSSSSRGDVVVRAFGAASDYYRLRMYSIEENSPSELDWDDDILFKEPDYYIDNRMSFQVEALDVSEGERYLLGEFSNKEEAETFLAQAEEHLTEMTKHQFDREYRLF